MIDRKIVIIGNGQEWCLYSINDLVKQNGKLINKPYPINGKISHFFVHLHFSSKINKKIKLPLKRLWFSSFAKNISSNRTDPLLLIFYDWNSISNNAGFLYFLRKYFQDVKLVYMFTNVARISGANKNGFLNRLNDYYDIVYAFDPLDAEKYGFKYQPLLYSKNTLENVVPGKSVFYVGNAKDRLSSLHKVYDRLKKLEEKTVFYITGVPEDKMLENSDIVYNHQISYLECLKNIQSSDCLLDIIQGDSSGFTIKVCEAVYYNKLLITTNEHVRELPFYDERYMKIIKSPDDIEKSFFDYRESVSYNEKGIEYFSVDSFLKRLSRDLVETE